MAPDEFIAWIDKACSELNGKAEQRIGGSGKMEMPLAGDPASDEHSAVIRLHQPSRQYEIMVEFFRLLDESCPHDVAQNLHREYSQSASSTVRELVWMMQECREQLLAAGELQTGPGITDPSSEQGGDGGPTRTRGKRRGRRKADFKTIQHEAQLVADWKRAKESGEYKGTFAKRNNMTVRQFEALLDRVRKRNVRSDK